MPEWLTQSLSTGAEVPLDKLIGRVLLAFALGAAVALVHRFTRPKNTPPTANLAATLVLLTILVAVVTQVIGENLARAFGLVGVLSLVRIVRFRTEVD